jgi:hypothetical protein
MNRYGELMILRVTVRRREIANEPETSGAGLQVYIHISPIFTIPERVKKLPIRHNRNLSKPPGARFEAHTEISLQSFFFF